MNYYQVLGIKKKKKVISDFSSLDDFLSQMLPNRHKKMRKMA